MIPQIVQVGIATSGRRRRLDLSIPVSVDVSPMVQCNSDHVEDYRCGIPLVSVALSCWEVRFVQHLF